jgi:hypothetical protein
MLISEECPMLREQLRRYVWKTTKTVGSKDPVIREPKKVDDHLPDAMRFGAVPLIEEGPLDYVPDPLTWAEAWEQERRARIFGPLKEELARAEAHRGWE